ncbi:unnamed protein product, partial [Adineta steineri]
SYNNDNAVIKKILGIALSCQSDSINTDNTDNNPVFTVTHYPSGIQYHIKGLTLRQFFLHGRLYGMYLGIRPASRDSNGEFFVEPDAPIIYSNCFSHVESEEINLNHEKYKFQISHMTVNVTNSRCPGIVRWSITCGVEVSLK